MKTSAYVVAVATGLTLAALRPLPAQAAAYYWDANGTAGGFGTAGGTWDASPSGSAYWNTSSAGTATPTTYISTTGDVLYLGYWSPANALGAGTITISGSQNINGINFAAGTTGVVLSGGTITFGGATPTVQFGLVDGTNSGNTINSTLAGSSGLTFVAGNSSGSSKTFTLNLGGNNSYTGGTAYRTLTLGNVGNLMLNSATALGTGNDLNMSGGTSWTQIYLANSGGQSIGNLTGDGWSVIRANTVDSTLTVNQTASTTFGGYLQNGDHKLALFKTGSGTLTLNNSTGSNYTGPTTINQGSLIVGYVNTFANASGTLTLNSGGIFTTANGVTCWINGPVVLNGGTLASGTEDVNWGSWALAQDVHATASSTISAVYVNWSTSGTRIFDVDNGVTLNVTGSFASRSVNVPAGFSITKTGSGTMTMSGANNYTGTTTVNQGWLVLNSATGSSSASLTVANGATVDMRVTNEFAKPWNISGAVLNTGAIAQTMNSTTLSGGSLTGTGTGLAGYGHFTISGASYSITHTGDITSTIAGTGSNGGLTLQGATALTFTVADGASAVDLLVSSAISEATGGTAGITKAGAGLMQLTGANTYTGSTTISAGTLTIASGGSISTSGNILFTVSGATAVANINGTYSSTGGGGIAVNSGGILNFNGSGTISGANNQVIGIGSAGGAGTFNMNGGSLSVNYTSNGWGIGNGGPGVLNVSGGTLTTATGDAFIVGFVAGGAGTLTVSGTGSVSGGGMTIGNATTAPGSVNLSVGGTISFTGGTFGNTGTANWNQTGGSASFSGQINVAQSSTGTGTLTISGGTFTQTGTALQYVYLGVGGNATMTIANSADVRLYGLQLGYGGTVQSIANLDGGTLKIGAGGVTSAGAGGSPVGTLSFNGGTFQAGASFATPSSRVNLVVNSGGAIVDTIGNALTFGSALTHGTGTPDGGLTKYGSGTLTLSGVSGSTYTGPTTINQGSLIAGYVNTFGTTSGTFTINSGGIFTTANGVTCWINGPVVLNGGTLASGTEDVNWGSWSLAQDVHATASSTISAVYVSWLTIGTRIFDVDNGVTLNVTGSFASRSGNVPTGFSITKTGSGTMTLSGANNYTGGTTVSAGALTIGGAGTLGGANYSGALTVNGALNINSTTSASWPGTITGSGTITFNNTAGYNYFTGTISGFTGTIVNTLGNTALGFAAGGGPAGASLQVDGGIIQLGANGATGGTYAFGALAGAGGIIQPDGNNSGGHVYTLQVGGLGTSTSYAGVLQNSSAEVLALTKTGAGTLTLTGASSFTGQITINAGSYLQYGNGGATGSTQNGSLGGNITNNGTLIFNRSNAITQGTDFSGNVISGSGAIVQNGTGTLTLSAANAYTGATTVNQGTLRVSGSGTLGDGNVTVAGGVLDVAVNNDVIDNNATLSIGNSAQVALAGGVNDTVKYLVIGGTTKWAGTWGASSLTADNTDPHFTGTGIVTVSLGNLHPASIIVFK